MTIFYYVLRDNKKSFFSSVEDAFRFRDFWGGQVFKVQELSGLEQS